MSSCNRHNEDDLSRINENKVLSLSNVKSFSSMASQSFSIRKGEKIRLGFSKLKEGEVVNFEKDGTIPYSLERKGDGFKMNINTRFLSEPLKIYNSKGELQRTILPPVKNGEIKAQGWPIVVIIVLCCVEAEVGSDGWKVGFDCDCISGS